MLSNHIHKTGKTKACINVSKKQANVREIHYCFITHVFLHTKPWWTTQELNTETCTSLWSHDAADWTWSSWSRKDIHWYNVMISQLHIHLLYTRKGQNKSTCHSIKTRFCQGTEGSALVLYHACNRERVKSSVLLTNKENVHTHTLKWSSQRMSRGNSSY
jgi:hypothetical protein